MIVSVSQIALPGSESAEVGQTSAPNEIDKLDSIFTTDARSRFGAEVRMTDASNSGVQVAEVDATDASWVTASPNLLIAITDRLTVSLKA